MCIVSASTYVRHQFPVGVEPCEHLIISQSFCDRYSVDPCHVDT